MTTASSNNVIRTVRLDTAALQELYERLESRNQEPGSRTNERFRYRLKSCLVHLQQPGSGSPIVYQVPTYDLSAQGIGFLHGGYLHPGTRCQFQLITTFGTWIDVSGVVMRCKHFQGLIHEIGAKFDDPIHPADFCEEANKVSILLAEDENLMYTLFKNHLDKLGGSVVLATNGKQAIEMASKANFDMIFMDIEMPVMDGLTAVRTLRQQGYSGMIVACTARTQPKDRLECLEAGCNEYLPKPYTKGSLESLLQSIKNEPIVSQFHLDVSMHEMIDACVADFPNKIKELENSLATSDIKLLAEVTRRIKVQAGGCGFELIMQMAVDLETAIHANLPPDDLKNLAVRLGKTCRLARPSGKKPPR